MLINWGLGKGGKKHRLHLKQDEAVIFDTLAITHQNLSRNKLWVNIMNLMQLVSQKQIELHVPATGIKRQHYL